MTSEIMVGKLADGVVDGVGNLEDGVAVGVGVCG